MKRAFQILKRDMRRLAHNPIAMIVVAGVCLLPSLYAWFNIAANMDPYGNTGAVQIAAFILQVQFQSGIRQDL